MKILRDKLNNISELNIFKNVYSQKPNMTDLNFNISITNEKKNETIKNTLNKENSQFNDQFSEEKNLVNKDILNEQSVIYNENLAKLKSKIEEYENYLNLNGFKIENYEKILQENIDLKKIKSRLDEEILVLSSNFKSPQIIENKVNSSYLNNSNLNLNEANIRFKNLIVSIIITKDENIKLKSEYALIEQINKEKEEYIVKLEKEKNMLTELNTTSISNNANNVPLKSIFLYILSRNEFTNKESNLKILNELFGQNFDFIKFLQMRVDSLELQNYYLISKNDKNTNIIKSYLDEMIEVYEVVSDIRNVLNQVYDVQSLTKEFMLIRETLNTKNDFLMKKKDIFFEEKRSLDSKAIKESNQEILACKDKVFECKEMLNSEYFKKQSHKIIEILEEKIENYENLKLNLIQYEDIIQRELEKNEDDDLDINKIKNVKMRETLVNENYLLKSKNLQLRNIIENILLNPTYVTIKDDTIMKDINSQLTTVTQVNQSFNKVIIPLR